MLVPKTKNADADLNMTTAFEAIPGKVSVTNTQVELLVAKQIGLKL